jgi:4'-phosphopantetheinyl transferase
MAALQASLSVEEIVRAGSLRRPRDRERFIAARGWLRALVGAELGCPSGEVPIVSRPDGKPEIPGTDLRFSVAHSDDLGLYAMTRGAELGVDVEAIRPEAGIDEVGALFFSPAERRMLDRVPLADRVRAAYQCWTCKEAYVKGTGAGLDDDVRDYETWTGDGEPARVRDWFIHEVDVGPGFAAALAIHRVANPVIQIQGARIG